ncbi:DeoR/GlpR family DNA-binding transcription regulator [Actinocorallia longicatena]|uniref:DeoR/GlpR family DNA-binding transcription regulator n=1 Tax=Actinocorallia longicatena TaxID=111803 RepID=A0ABP6QI49_9ACTN
MASSHLRHTRLLDLLAERGSLDVEEAAAALDVSPATIRRDLDRLAHQQLVRRTRGGAVAAEVAYDLPLRYKAARAANEKQRIAATAAALVGRGRVVGLNGGTTTSEVARELAGRTDLTIVTNAVNIAAELTVRPQIKTVMTGGAARPNSYELIGPLAAATLRSLALDEVILGVDALDPVFGASAHHEGEAEINHLMADRAARVIVVADASKLGTRAFARICPAEAITTLVTDAAADPAMVEALKSTGISVILC